MSNVPSSNDSPMPDTPTPNPVTHVVVSKANDSLFGKVFRVLKETEEWVIAEIKTELGWVNHLFHKSNVQPTPAPAKGDAEPPPVLVSAVGASTVASTNPNSVNLANLDANVAAGEGAPAKE